MTYGWSLTCLPQSCGTLWKRDSDVTTDLLEGSSPPTQGSRLQTPGQEGPASALHKSPKLWLNRLPLRLAQLPNGQEFTARSPHTLILFFPHGCPAGPQTMKALWQSRVQAPFSLNSGAWVCCLWAPTQEKN